MYLLEREVQQTASLLSPGGYVHAKLGTAWAADFKTRTISFRPDDPRTGEPLDHTETLCDIGHESGHLEYTGGYTPGPRIRPEYWKAFHRLLNAGEDVRIERLLSVEFPGFKKIIEPSNRRVMLEQKDRYKELSKVDQLGYYLLARESDVHDQIEWDEVVEEYGNAMWPKFTRWANARSTAVLAELLERAFLDLMELSDKSESLLYKLKAAMGSGEDGDILVMVQNLPDGGGDEPSDKPERSEGKLMPGGGDLLERLEGEAQDAPNGSAQTQAKANKEANARAQAAKTLDTNGLDDAAAAMGCGTQPYESPWTRTNEQLWITTRDLVRPQINQLHNRMRAILRHNAMGDWSRGHRRGRFDSSRAYKTAFNGNHSVFKKKTRVGNTEYAFGFSMDVSGSMQGNAHIALQAFVIMAETLEKLEQPWFATFWAGKAMLHKPLNMPLSSIKGTSAALLNAMPGHNTLEPYGLTTCLREMSKIPLHVPKMLLSITDGGTGLREESEAMLQRFKHMDTRMVCIGINTNPAHWPEHITIRSATELPDLLSHYIAQCVRRGWH